MGPVCRIGCDGLSPGKPALRFSTADAPDGAAVQPGADAARRAREADCAEGRRPRARAQGQPEDARQARAPQHAAGRRGELSITRTDFPSFYPNITNTDRCKEASVNDIRKNFEILDPLLPLVHIRN